MKDKVLGWKLYELMRDIQRKEDWDSPLDTGKETIEDIKNEIYDYFELGSEKE